MLFKFLLFLTLPLYLLATPGYHTPWGKDVDLSIQKKSEKNTTIDSPAAFLAKKLILFHQKILSPVDGPRSHFYPCSSQYMKLAITKHGFIRGFIMGCDRLIREDSDPWVYQNIIIDGKLVKYDPPK